MCTLRRCISLGRAILCRHYFLALDNELYMTKSNISNIVMTDPPSNRPRYPPNSPETTYDLFIIIYDIYKNTCYLQ